MVNARMPADRANTDSLPDLDVARRTLRSEADALERLIDCVDEAFARACKAIHGCEGMVVLTGIGKAGIIARKISATLASTGTRSIFLHPVEALHGDLGRLQRRDVVVALSNSGASEEIIRLLDHIHARGAKLVAMTSDPASPLGRYADITLCYGRIEEACPHKLAPTVSTTCMLAMGDALALTIMQMRRFTPEDFAVFHPGGSLGRRLLKVEDAMWFRKGERLTVASDAVSLGDALEEAQRNDPRRAGAMLLVDGEGRLSGLITDADLRRLLMRHRGQDVLERPVREVMTHEPTHVHVGDLASKVLAVMNEKRFDELPVLDDDDRPVGIIDVQDLLGIQTLGDNPR
jgi:arabinose-5-phosphate isomerase